MTRTPIYPTSGSFQSRLSFDLSATILTGQTVSQAIDVGGSSIVGIIIPATLIGTYLYFNVWDGDVFVPAYLADPSNITRMQMRINTGVVTAYPIVPCDFAAFQQIQIVSDTTQTSDITIKLIARALA